MPGSPTMVTTWPRPASDLGDALLEQRSSCSRPTKGVSPAMLAASRRVRALPRPRSW